MIKILMAASEAVPFAKTGGLADVLGSLPKALLDSGADVRVIMPQYESIPDRLKGSITHMSTLDPRSKSYNWNGMISRVLYIKDNLYTISENGVKANSIKDLKEVDYLRLK
jgi:glycogen synthase